MLKKSLRALALGALVTTAAVAGGSSKSPFMNGVSVGVGGGWGFNQIKTQGQTFKYNTPDVALHIDFNRPLSSAAFWGVGGEISYAFKKKDFQFLGQKVTLRRQFGGALTARIGTQVADSAAFDANVAVLATSWKTVSTGGASQSKVRFGFAPGINFTLAATKYVAVSAGYRYEFYPKSSSQPKIDSHRVMVKVSFPFA